jgi:PAS domain S-box-containing protein
MKKLLGKLGARNLVTLGLVSVVTSILLVATLLGMVPDETSAKREARAAVSEMVAAVSGGYLSQAHAQRLGPFLAFVLERNRELKSIAVRQADGKLLASAGPHQNWQEPPEGRSTEDQVVVPLSVQGKVWGRCEIQFVDMQAAGVLGFLMSPRTQLLIFMAFACFTAFSLYLKRVLKQLDPSEAVPDRVRSALDTLVEGLLVIDGSGSVVLANKAFLDLSGKTENKVVGHKIGIQSWLSSNGDALEQEQFPWVKAQASAQSEVNSRIYLNDAQGKRRSFLVNCSPVLSADGKVNGVLISLDDITHLEEVEAELREAKKAADSANSAKSDFLANMSHEIRTPMNAILGFTDVLRRGLYRDPSVLEKHLSTIHSNGKHLLELINDILDLSKVEAGRLDIESISFKPHQVIAEVQQIMRVKAEEKGIGLRFAYEGQVVENIQSDSGRLRQMVTNLVGNAIKFTDKGEVLITERFVRIDGRFMFQVSVKDSGIGIAKDKLDKVFEAFVQAESSTTRRFGGTGLGLPISRKFARAMGGDISVASVLREGSVFTITIDPHLDASVRWIEPSELSQANIQSAAQDKIKRWKFSAAKVLVVDDGVENRELARLLLEEAGLTVSEATNGKEAVMSAITEKFDLILMDMSMPVMDGFTATKILREKGLKLPIVALTAHAMAGFEAEILESGCTGYLTKPIDIDKLFDTLATFLKAESSMIDKPSHASKVNAATSASGEEILDDVSPIVSRLASHPKLRHVAASFCVRLPGQLKLMDDALAANDFEALSQLAHWLKGGGGSVGYDPFTSPAAQLEVAAKKAQSEQCQQAMAIIKNIAARIVNPSTESTQPLVAKLEEASSVH